MVQLPSIYGRGLIGEDECCDGAVTDDNGLIYMRARYYSPEMKRFLNADSIVDWGNNILQPAGLSIDILLGQYFANIA